MNIKQSTIKPIDPAFRQTLHDFFKNDVKKLESLIGLELSHWK